MKLLRLLHLCLVPSTMLYVVDTVDVEKARTRKGENKNLASFVISQIKRLVIDRAENSFLSVKKNENDRLEADLTGEDRLIDPNRSIQNRLDRTGLKQAAAKRHSSSVSASPRPSGSDWRPRSCGWHTRMRSWRWSKPCTASATWWTGASLPRMARP